MVSKVVMTRKAQRQLKQFISYLLKQFNNKQAASAVIKDARETQKALLNVAGSLTFCADEELKALGYHTIHFKRHRYFFIYEIRGNIAYIEAVYHDLQDYENLFKEEFLRK